MEKPDPLDEARKRAASDLVKVSIHIPEYECPGHYPWFYLDPKYPVKGTHWGTPGKDYFEIPRAQYERWCRIQLEWEEMNEEMHQISGLT